MAVARPLPKVRKAVNPVLVAPIEEMQDRVFAKHMEHRHADSLGYVQGLRTILSNDMLVRMWRLYHGHLHRWRIDLAHEHEERYGRG